MSGLSRRVTRLEQADDQEAGRECPERPHSASWLLVLRAVLPWFGEHRNDIAGRIEKAIAFLEEYAARGRRGPVVEAHCGTWLMAFQARQWQDSVADPDMAGKLRACELLDDEWRPGA